MLRDSSLNPCSIHSSADGVGLGGPFYFNANNVLSNANWNNGCGALVYLFFSHDGGLSVPYMIRQKKASLVPNGKRMCHFEKINKIVKIR